MDIHFLVKAAKKGDPDAYYQLIQQYKTKLYRIAYSFLKNENDALEAIQEVTCRAYIKIKKLKEPQYFSTWVIRIMLNYCMDELKKRNRMAVKELDLENDKRFQFEEQAFTLNQVEIEEAIHTLDPNYQLVIQLKYLNDLTITDIAEALGRPEGTIKTWIHKALKLLKLQLEKEGRSHA